MIVVLCASACHGLTSRKQEACLLPVRCCSHDVRRSRSLLAVEDSPGKRPMPPEQGPEWAPSAHARGLFAAANGSCGGGMLVFQAGKRVAMPQRQWLPYARAAASVAEPQEQCRLETATALASGVDHPESQIPSPSPSPSRDGSKLRLPKKTSVGFAVD